MVGGSDEKLWSENRQLRREIDDLLSEYIDFRCEVSRALGMIESTAEATDDSGAKLAVSALRQALAQYVGRRTS